MKGDSKMKRYTLLILYILAMMGWVCAQNPADDWFKKANDAYNAGNYDTAAMLYEKILATDMESVPVYYNLGNAYYRMKDFPKAIYNYEKALKLDPSNEDVRANLEFANLSIEDKSEPVPESFIVKGWRELRSMCSSDSWAWWSVVAFALMLASVLLFLRSRRIGLRKLGFFAGIVFLVVFALSVVFTAQLRRAATAQDQAIIMSPTVTAKSSPNENGVDVFVLHEGTKVTILGSSNGWNKVRIAKGDIGWIEEEQMLPF